MPSLRRDGHSGGFSRAGSAGRRKSAEPRRSPTLAARRTARRRTMPMALNSQSPITPPTMPTSTSTSTPNPLPRMMSPVSHPATPPTIRLATSLCCISCMCRTSKKIARGAEFSRVRKNGVSRFVARRRRSRLLATESRRPLGQRFPVCRFSHCIESGFVMFYARVSGWIARKPRTAACGILPRGGHSSCDVAAVVLPSAGRESTKN